jgi:hypothetical protein
MRGQTPGGVDEVSLEKYASLDFLPGHFQRLTHVAVDGLAVDRHMEVIAVDGDVDVVFSEAASECDVIQIHG